MPKILYHTKSFTELTSIEWEQLSELTEKVFEMRLTSEKLSEKGACEVTYAALEGEIVGYKVGYPENTSRFYSWLGCVDPQQRGKGIGEALMKTQHEYCQTQGYKQITTKTMNKWRGMLLLNIKMGFDIVGVTQNSGEELKIHLSKNLEKGCHS